MKHIVTKTMWTETGHRLVDYPGKCAHLHGHSYRWTVALSSKTLDDLGMVCDFKDLKRLMNDHIGLLDHAFIFCDRDPLLHFANKCLVGGAKELLRATNKEDPRIIVLDDNPTVERLAKMVYESLDCTLRTIDTGLRPDVKLEYVEVRETETSICRYCGDGRN